ncbi:hypothetical protein [Humibacter sp.]|uniref:hypothetical protein n=1 Tax=Humibacter sp. TaxID=1940291 RepID=UPI002C19BBEC|nr:hypothetical protein [Humibacter sp.]HVX08800.1 hypothetical protein [Humibacter sp.]
MGQLDGETWVSPVTAGSEADPHRLEVWRFRILVALVVLAATAGAIYLALSLTGTIAGGDSGGGVG